jgi:predicted ABC-type ATPase
MRDFMTPDHEPTVYVIAGPNGAGKTTFAMKFLPDFVHCREFVNADLIAAGLSPFAPETQAMRAGRLLLTRLEELSVAHQDFGFESTLSGRSYVNVLNNLKEAGYHLVLFFLWLPDADLAVARVANRVRQDGHGVPEETIRRRFDAGLRNLFDSYRRLVDEFWLYDASRFPPGLIVRESMGQRGVHQPELAELIARTWGNPSDE